MISLTINGKKQEFDLDPDTPLLWVLRDELQMTGTKLGCGMALCGACTVHMNGTPVRSCSLPLSAVRAFKPLRVWIRPHSRRCSKPGAIWMWCNAAIANPGK